MLHRFGLEGLITFKRENRYDPDNYEIFVPHDPSNPNSPEAKIGVFDKVTVEITVEKVRPAFHSKVVTMTDKVGVHL